MGAWVCKCMCDLCVCVCVCVCTSSAPSLRRINVANISMMRFYERSVKKPLRSPHSQCVDVVTKIPLHCCHGLSDREDELLHCIPKEELESEVMAKKRILVTNSMLMEIIKMSSYMREKPSLITT